MDAPPADWADTVAEITKWIFTAPEGPHCHFKLGHVRAAHATGKTTFLPRSLWSSVVARLPDVQVLHAVPETELYRLQNILKGDDPAKGWHERLIARTEAETHMIICSFAQLAESVLSRLQTGHESNQPQVFVLDLQLQCPTDLVQALVATQALAWHTSNPLALLTMSPDEPPAYLNNLFSDIAPAGPHTFVLPQKLPLAHERASWFSGSQFGISEAIESAIDSYPDRSHMILSLHSGFDIEYLQDVFETSAMHIYEPVNHLHTMPSILADEDRLKRVALTFPHPSDGPDTPENVRIVQAREPESWHFRGHVKGFYHVHIVISHNTKHCIFDGWTRQFVQVTTACSTQQRMDLLAWAGRNDADKVSFYVDDPEPGGVSRQRYLAGGSQHRYLHISNHQLLGSMLCMIPFQPWTDKLWKDLIHGVWNRAALREVIRRTVLLGIIHGEIETEQCTIISQDRGICAMFFDQALPLVHYDTRLALLLALGGPPSVMCVKLHLAALVTTGIGSVFKFEKALTAEELHTDGCGLMSRLAYTGTVWALLDLWQCCMSQFACQQNDMKWLMEDDEVLIKPLHGYFAAPSLHVDPLAARQAWIRYKQLSEVARIAGCLPFGQPDFAESMTADDATMLQKHLLRSFAQQLTYAFETDNGFEIHDYTSGQKIEAGGMADMTVPWEQISQCHDLLDKSSPMVGIYCGRLSREDAGARLQFEDWNWMPKKLVDEWLLENGASDLQKAVGSHYPFHYNHHEVVACEDGPYVYI